MIVELTLSLHGPAVKLSKQTNVDVQKHLSIEIG